MSAAAAESARTGRSATWRRRQAGSGATVVERLHVDHYGECELLSIAQRAAAMAAAAAAKGRRVAGGGRLKPVSLSDYERDALASELTIRCLEADTGNGIRYGAISDTPNGTAAERRDADRLNLVGSALAMIATPDKGGRDAWRDVAAIHSPRQLDKLAAIEDNRRRDREGRPREAIDLTDAAVTDASGDAMIRPLRRRDALAPETETALVLSGLDGQQRAAIRAALSMTTARDWAGHAQGRGSAQSWRDATCGGRKKLKRRLGNPATPSAMSAALRSDPALAAIIAADDGFVGERPQSAASLMREPSPILGAGSARRAAAAAARQVALARRYPAHLARLLAKHRPAPRRRRRYFNRPPAAWRLAHVALPIPPTPATADLATVAAWYRAERVAAAAALSAAERESAAAERRATLARLAAERLRQRNAAGRDDRAAAADRIATERRAAWQRGVVWRAAERLARCGG